MDQGLSVQSKQVYEQKVAKKLYLFKWQIEALKIFEENATEAGQRNICNKIYFLKHKQKALEDTFHSFRKTDGFAWQEMKKGIDALQREMLYSLSKAHTEIIEAAY